MPISYKHGARNRRVVVGILILVMLTGVIHRLNDTFEPRLKAAAKMQVNVAINNLVSKVIAKLDYDRSDLLFTTTDVNGKVSQIEYNTVKLNQILSMYLNTIDESIIAAQNGKKDPLTDRVFFKDGIVYELPLGYLTQISLFSNWGPKIPIRIQLLNHVSGEIITKSEPYGMNNTLLKIMLEMRIEAQAITALQTNEIVVVSHIPLVIQLVNGEVPDLSPYRKGS